MKHTKKLVIVGFLFSFATASAKAGLLSRGGGTMVYDTVQDVTWVADANLFKTQATDPNLVNNIIANVGTVTDIYYGSKTLTPSDFDPYDGSMSWWGAQAWAANLNYGGVSDWRLPAVAVDCDGYNCGTEGEVGHLFYSELGGRANYLISDIHNDNYSLFSNIQADMYWLGSELTIAPDLAWDFFITGSQSYHHSGSLFNAWAVRSGDVGQVPVPAAVWTFCSGLLGLIGLRRANRMGYIV